MTVLRAYRWAAIHSKGATMKLKITLVVTSLLLASIAVAGSEDEIVTVEPQQPVVGEEITIRYNPVIEGAMLFGAEAVEVQILLMREKQVPLLIETPMMEKDNVWVAKVSLDDPAAVFGGLRFVSDKVMDTNNDAYWDFLVYGKDGKPAKGAHLARSKSYVWAFMDWERERDLARAREEALKEEMLYPHQPETKFWVWEIEFAEKGRDSVLVDEIEQELEKMVEHHPNDEETVRSVIRWYRRLDRPEKGRALEDRFVERDPLGDFAKSVKFERIYGVRDASERAKRALQYLEEFPESEASERASVARILMQDRQFDTAEKIILSLQPPDGNVLNSLAWTYIDDNIDIERGVELAKQGVEALRNIDPGLKPPYYPEKRWKHQQDTNLGYVLDTYAFGLFKLGRYRDAQEAYREAYELTEGSNPDINERLLQCYLRNGEYAAAVEVTKECIENMNYSDKLLEYGNEAFAKKEGSTEGFDQLIEAARERAMVKAKGEALKKRFDRPAPDFEARNLSGDVIQLAKLRGKVVVLDFWATWCGPCKAAFPYVQKLYEKYQDNPDVVILAVNTWERVEGDERYELVKSFMEENKYTFPVVYDESGVVDRYKVQGVPTQFYIDREGTIRFREIGFHGPQMEFLMAVMIDMLLSGETLSAK